MIKNWARYQHYGKESSPSWIKLYVSLLSDIAFRSLRDQSKLLWFHLMLISASNQNKLDLTQATLRRVCGIRVKRDSIQELIDSGMLVPYDSRLALEKVYGKEKEKKEKTDKKEKIEETDPDLHFVELFSSLQKSTQDLIRQGLDVAANTRKSGTMSDNIRIDTMDRLAKCSEQAIIDGTMKYINQHTDKPEKYWCAIVANKNKEQIKPIPDWKSEGFL